MEAKICFMVFGNLVEALGKVLIRVLEIFFKGFVQTLYSNVLTFICISDVCMGFFRIKSSVFNFLCFCGFQVWLSN